MTIAPAAKSVRARGAAPFMAPHRAKLHPSGAVGRLGTEQSCGETRHSAFAAWINPNSRRLEEEAAPYVSLIGAVGAARQSSSCAAKQDTIRKNDARVNGVKTRFWLYSLRCRARAIRGFSQLATCGRRDPRQRLAACAGSGAGQEWGTCVLSRGLWQRSPRSPHGAARPPARPQRVRF
jgi:hypothetical protein